jgi:hypothetical protein
MNGIQTVEISDGEANKVLTIEEGHFTDVKESFSLDLMRTALRRRDGGEGLRIRKPLTPMCKSSNNCSLWEQITDTSS